jgi:hypothetical protein
MITNTTSPTDPTILLPAQDGDAANQRKQGVKFVCVQLRLDFSSFANAGVTTNLCTLLEEYYIDLPQSTKSLNTGTNQAYNLTAWQGTANLKGMSCDKVKTEILNVTLQDGPVNLQLAAFGLTSARTDDIVLG